MSAEDSHLLDAFEAPFGKKIELLEVSLENDVRLLKVRIREGSRFTILDLDPVTAKRWGEAMAEWAAGDDSD